MAERISSMVHPEMFFLPSEVKKISERVSLIQGDMFFSDAQTLTISTNTVGVMGKGLASRAKYLFPDIYVHYQDLCRAKKHVMGRPDLVKRNKSLDEEYADDVIPLPVEERNAYKWFLLFPTKKHWKENSDMQGIERGLIYLKEHYKEWGVESLALPALGCGLGKLVWKEVGRIIVRHCSEFDIPCKIHLPNETIEEKYKTAEYLLS